MHCTIAGPRLGKAAICIPIVRSLPEWFGIEAAIAHYATAIDHLPAGAGTEVNKEAPSVLDMISSLLGALTGAFGTLTTLVALVLGLLSLFLGRRFFWLFIGLAGFAVGLVLSQGLASGADEAVRPLLVLGLAILFGVLAIVAQRIMAALAGAVVLALVAYTLTAGFPSWMQVMATLIGGLIGAALAGWLLDWGLIVGSALLGSLMVSSVIDGWIASAGMLSFVLFVALALAGVVYQARDLTRG